MLLKELSPSVAKEALWLLSKQICIRGVCVTPKATNFIRKNFESAATKTTNALLISWLRGLDCLCKGNVTKISEICADTVCIIFKTIKRKKQN